MTSKPIDISPPKGGVGEKPAKIPTPKKDGEKVSVKVRTF